MVNREKTPEIIASMSIVVLALVASATIYLMVMNQSPAPIPQSVHVDALETPVDPTATATTDPADTHGTPSVSPTPETADSVVATSADKNTEVQEQPVNTSENIQIRITNGDRVLYGILANAPAANDLASMLPITIDIEDYHNTEKIGYPSRRLNTEGEPAGTDPDVGHITYYAPWGNLAIFYRDFGYSNGLVHLGQITEGVDELANLGGSMTIEIDK